MAGARKGCLFLLAGMFSRHSRPMGENLPYAVSDSFLSDAELAFLRVLRGVVGKDSIICPKVRLLDILYVTRPEQRQAFQNKIMSKHVDFLLCNSQSMRPVLGIELDDSSHQRSRGRERDAFVNRAFAAASLPLLRFQAHRSYSPDDVGGRIAAALKSGGGGVAPTAPEALHAARIEGSGSAAPTCPKCGVAMVLRTSRRGARKGQQFYGCPNYPDCKETMQLP